MTEIKKRIIYNLKTKQKNQKKSRKQKMWK